jgi:rod shape determining protein RodA
MNLPTVNLTRLGWGLAIPVLILSAFGVASIHATDRSIANTIEVDQPGRVAPVETDWLDAALKAIGPLTVRQAVYLVTGVGLLFVVLAPSYRRIGRYAFRIYWLLIVLLALLLAGKYGSLYGIDLPLVGARRDVWRWIQFGPVSIQPSEFMKVGLILALAYYLRYRKSYRTWLGLIPPFLLTLLPMVLILKQPDLGTLLMLLPVLFVMLFVAGARLRHLATIVLLGCATVPAFYFFGMEDYQRERIQVLFKQNIPDESWHNDQGYQLRQSLIALGTGGLTGEGYGEGAFVRYNLLPEEHNDFIFAVIGHQWGLTGCVIVILAYVVIIICGLEVAMVTNDPFGRLLAVGVVVMIVVQALLNICMNLGLAPITGMTLPFVSAGGSSLWTNFLALGLLVNVAQRRPMLIGHPPFEHEDD